MKDGVLMTGLFAGMIGYYKTLQGASASNKPVKYVIGKDGMYEVIENDIGTFIKKTKTIRGTKEIKEGFVTELPDVPRITYENSLYLIGNDGVYRVISRDIGKIIRKTSFINEATNIKEKVSLKLPKIPRYLFAMTVDFFREMAKKHKVEVMVEFWYDKVTKKYFLNCPKQIVSKINVEYVKDKDLILDDTKILVAEVHSHNYMPPIFSVIDDKDELETRFYGVIGSLYGNNVSSSFRMGINGHFSKIRSSDLFRTSSKKYEGGSFPKEWLSQVTFSEKKFMNKPMYSKKSYDTPSYLFSYSTKPTMPKRKSKDEKPCSNYQLNLEDYVGLMRKTSDQRLNEMLHIMKSNTIQQ